MKHTHLLALALSVGALAAGATPARAQGPVSLQTTFGVGTGLGGPDARYRTGVSLDALLGVALHAKDAGGPVVGLAGAAQGWSTRDELCVYPSGGTGQCHTDFPLFGSVAALGGWESASGGTRLLAGPAFFFSEDDRTAAGATGQADLSFGGWRHVLPVLSLRASFLPDYRGDAVTLLSAGVGFRVH